MAKRPPHHICTQSNKNNRVLATGGANRLKRGFHDKASYLLNAWMACSNITLYGKIIILITTLCRWNTHMSMKSKENRHINN